MSPRQCVDCGAQTNTKRCRVCKELKRRAYNTVYYAKVVRPKKLRKKKRLKKKAHKSRKGTKIINYRVGIHAI